LCNENKSLKACEFIASSKELSKKQEENPIAFYDTLEEAFRKYTTVDPESIEGAALLNHHFVNQLVSDIRGNLQKLNLGSLTNKTQLIDITFQVFNNRNLEEERRARVRKEGKPDLWLLQLGLSPVLKRHP
jgi:hypothetical protein